MPPPPNMLKLLVIKLNMQSFIIAQCLREKSRSKSKENHNFTIVEEPWQALYANKPTSKQQNVVSEGKRPLHSTTTMDDARKRVGCSGSSPSPAGKPMVTCL